MLRVTRAFEKCIARGGSPIGASPITRRRKLNVVGKTAPSLYALKTLKTHGLCGQALWEVTQAVLVAQLLYASPAWSGS